MTTDTNSIGLTPVRMERLGPAASPSSAAGQPARVIEFQRKAAAGPIEVSVEKQQEVAAYIRDVNAVITGYNISSRAPHEVPTEGEVESIVSGLGEQLRKAKATGEPDLLCHNLEPLRVIELLKD